MCVPGGLKRIDSFQTTGYAYVLIIPVCWAVHG